MAVAAASANTVAAAATAAVAAVATELCTDAAAARSLRGGTEAVGAIAVGGGSFAPTVAAPSLHLVRWRGGAQTGQHPAWHRAAFTATCPGYLHVCPRVSHPRESRAHTSTFR